VKTSVTTLSLPASRINIGAQQYVTSALTLNTAVTGVGGCDVAVAANSVYYTYAVVSSGVVYLIGSLSSSLPAGFTQARKVGAFTTGTTSQILEAFYYGQGAVVERPLSWTPVFAGIGVPAITESKYSRAGELLASYGRITSGTATSDIMTMTLPGSWSANVSASVVAGQWWRNNASANTRKRGVIWATSGSNVLNFSADDYVWDVSPLATQAGSNLIGSSTIFTFELKIPIAEWAGSGTQFVW
jgi:hypothetical protein